MLKAGRRNLSWHPVATSSSRDSENVQVGEDAVGSWQSAPLTVLDEVLTDSWDGRLARLAPSGLHVSSRCTLEHQCGVYPMLVWLNLCTRHPQRSPSGHCLTTGRIKAEALGCCFARDPQPMRVKCPSCLTPQLGGFEACCAVSGEGDGLSPFLHRGTHLLTLSFLAFPSSLSHLSKSSSLVNSVHPSLASWFWGSQN